MDEEIKETDAEVKDSTPEELETLPERPEEDENISKEDFDKEIAEEALKEEKRNVNKVYYCPKCHAKAFVFNNMVGGWKCKECGYIEMPTGTKKELPTAEEFIEEQREEARAKDAKIIDEKMGEK